MSDFEIRRVAGGHLLYFRGDYAGRFPSYDRAFAARMRLLRKYSGPLPPPAARLSQPRRQRLRRISGGPSIIVLESFDAPDGTLIADRRPTHAPPGQRWLQVKQAGAADAVGDIQGGRGRIQDDNDGRARGFIVEAGRSTGRYRLSHEGNSVNPSWTGFLFRHSGGSQPTDGWIARSVPESSLIQLIPPIGGTTQASFTFGPGHTVDYELVVTLAGMAFTASNRDTGEVVTLERTSSFAATAPFVGIYNRTAFGGGASDWFENFEMKSY